MSEHRIQHGYAHECTKKYERNNQNKRVEFLIPIKIHKEHSHETGFDNSDADGRYDIIGWWEIQVAEYDRYNCQDDQGCGYSE